MVKHINNHWLQAAEPFLGSSAIHEFPNILFKTNVCLRVHKNLHFIQVDFGKLRIVNETHAYCKHGLKHLLAPMTSSAE
jgi:hypothetical protein